jgi:phosphatidylserine/phosphatidylglycerophosphate/cardiolipin synthase-like enzyme
MSTVDKDLYLSSENIGKKVYEIEEEITYVVKTQVIAKDDDEAFNKYLECSDTVNSEGYNAKDNGNDVVNSYAKEYSEQKGTTLIGTIQKEDKDDEDSLLEVVYG